MSFSYFVKTHPRRYFFKLIDEIIWLCWVLVVARVLWDLSLCPTDSPVVTQGLSC